MSQLDEKDIVKVASMYYDEGMTQAAIARKLGVSRSLISKILIDARNEGIVEVYIRSKDTYTVSLERELEKKFKLNKAVVVDTYLLNEPEIEKKVYQDAANCVIKMTANISTLGISWGQSIRGMINHYPYTNQGNIEIYPLIGGMGDHHVEIHSNQLSYDLARKMHATAKYLYAPALMDNEFIKKELLANSAICNVIEFSKNVDLAIVGISTPYGGNTMSQIGYINEQNIAEFKELGVVGDINSQFFNDKGEVVNHSINRNVVGIGLEDLRKIPNVLVIGFGMNKFEAIKVALTYNLVNNIVTTDKIATKLLEED